MMIAFGVKGVWETTKEELDKQHEEECPNWKLLQGMNRYLDRAVNDSLHALVISIIAIILSAISIILHYVEIIAFPLPGVKRGIYGYEKD